MLLRTLCASLVSHSSLQHFVVEMLSESERERERELVTCQEVTQFYTFTIQLFVSR
jgi:hypothetical protein